MAKTEAPLAADETPVPDRSENDVFMVPGTNIVLDAYPPGHPDDPANEVVETRNDATEWAKRKADEEAMEAVLGVTPEPAPASVTPSSSPS